VDHERRFKVSLYLRYGQVVQVESVGMPTADPPTPNPDGGVTPPTLYFTPPEDRTRSLVLLDMQEVVAVTADELDPVEDRG